MRNIKWTRAHAVHVPEVDREHQALFQLCADLQAAVTERAPASQVQSILHELVAHTAEHFSHEESQMRAAGYAHYAWHRRQHLAARSKVALLERRIGRGDRDAALELLTFLPAWLNDHVRLADRMLGAHLRNRERARCAKPS